MKKWLVFILLVAFKASFLQADDFFESIPILPADVVKKVNDWLISEEDLIKKLVLQEGDLADHQIKHTGNNEALREKGIINYSRSNYVFACPAEPDYMIKISGPTNRLVNTIVANEKWPTRISDEELYELKRVATYQTVSSLPTYYLYLRLQKLMPLKSVYIPKTYLFKLPQASDVINDTNYIILQERVSFLPKKESKELLKNLNNDQANELVAIVASCGLWDIKNNILIADDGRLVIVDLEQPNISNPLKGFNIQEIDRFNNNMNCGLNDLKEMLGKENCITTKPLN
ncbi:TPA: hypothetical protein DIC20_01470 [Candidatus Dependentiae bacterium]|nr:MAG: hypothetical protein US03_C0002G0097 [candidate division TM6 bacterium GW2011_GWF2_36_131]KKQ03530.1 MAG: hypothetical protein US13_C0002G0096 [candidate division TM6 bacterium GW2011_GWE2_36_25]KKQ20195.1 MAG: hypothetical protein US32_C0001G0092 [candidate division TM6 bacterium GW2011_GWA2_36_9]HBR70735.1 hypothetical protein [Candidatus Dependentiae bacterium]HCU00355.1 hypothetical protein [Candidatus Dependentiae bacterium]